jgi:pyruvate formate lyase activating enzyme
MSRNFLAALIFISVSLFIPSLAETGREASFYDTLAQGQVDCRLCPRKCTLKPGQTGYCRVRRNVDGKLKSLVYGQVCALNVDPVEKKPLYHFLPGTRTLSLATAGCSMRCLFCQNWSISQAEPDDVEASYMTPDEMVRLALEDSCPSISYTYSEPAVFYEYMFDISRKARSKGIRNIMVTSGHIDQEPLDSLCRYLDAVNLDLKGFSNEVYLKMANTRLSPILDALKIVKKNGVWLEVGYLVIPTVNDDSTEISRMTDWVAKELGRDVPLHFLRFFPQHKLSNLPPTPLSAMEMACRIAKRSKLDFVYLGNVPGHRANNTYCPGCGKMIVERKGYFTTSCLVKNGRCEFCGKSIAGIWKI